VSTPAAVAADRNSHSQSFEIHEAAPGRFEVHGALTFTTARRAREQGLQALRASRARDIEVDCSGVVASDSAGLTVLLDWLAHAKREGRSLRFTNLPAELLAIARISEVDELLQRGV
jgi:phospholipid transport system transporter-binding protein